MYRLYSGIDVLQDFQASEQTGTKEIDLSERALNKHLGYRYNPKISNG